jgi:DNA-binding transcriptional MerR regulator
MTPPPDRRYETSEFAALAGVTPRALRYYDRLGLLRPKRSRAGYRIYTERDLETLEEIVALKFIGVPLKEIAAIRRRPKRSFAQVLHAQREALEAKQRTLTRAIAAIAAAEASLRSSTALDAELFRRIIEVMHMNTNHEQTMATYTAMLRAKASHLSSLSAQQRAALQQQWSTLLSDVNAAVNEDPGSPKAQNLLDRWLSLLQALAGTDSTARPPTGFEALRATPEIEEALWARRKEWLPPDVVRETGGATADDALEHARERARSFAGSDVLAFIRRARQARDKAR